MKRINNLNQLREYLNEVVFQTEIERLKERGKKCYADTDYRWLIGNGKLDSEIEYEDYLRILDEEIAKYEIESDPSQYPNSIKVIQLKDDCIYSDGDCCYTANGEPLLWYNDVIDYIIGKEVEWIGSMMFEQLEDFINEGNIQKEFELLERLRKCAIDTLTK